VVRWSSSLMIVLRSSSNCKFEVKIVNTTALSWCRIGRRSSIDSRYLLMSQSIWEWEWNETVCHVIALSLIVVSFCIDHLMQLDAIGIAVCMWVLRNVSDFNLIFSVSCHSGAVRRGEGAAVEHTGTCRRGKREQEIETREFNFETG